jgi:hypothetical protein
VNFNDEKTILEKLLEAQKQFVGHPPSTVTAKEIYDLANAIGTVTAPSNDPVNHPAHYTAGGIECIDAIREALGDEAFVAYCRGNAIKYLWRTGRKQNAAEDLRKAAWYCSRAANILEVRNGA